MTGRNTMTARTILAKQIEANLERLGLSVPAFADKIDMPKQTIYRLIRCERAASVDTVEKLAKGFEVPRSVLLMPLEQDSGVDEE